MCELLGMSANVPTDICFSFTGLVRRGGDAGPHRDGWGIAFYEHGGVREFKDYLPSSDSAIARFLRDYPIKSRIVVSHIRQANVGDIRLENTHPFQRELWGRAWTYAHNGQLEQPGQLACDRFQPIGDTDSERAFCWLLDGLQKAFSEPPDQSTWAAFVADRAEQLNAMGVFNLLLSDGHALLTFCSTKLCWITRRAPFGTAHLADEDVTVDFSAVTTETDIVTVIATRPLTDNEAWQVMAPGECRLFVDGESPWVVHTRAPKRTNSHVEAANRLL
jgi:glutamine amidotransferase